MEDKDRKELLRKIFEEWDCIARPGLRMTVTHRYMGADYRAMMELPYAIAVETQRGASATGVPLLGTVTKHRDGK